MFSTQADSCIHIFAIISLFAAELEEPKIGILGKKLNPLFMEQFIYIVYISQSYRTTYDRWFGEILQWCGRPLGERGWKW